MSEPSFSELGVHDEATLLPWYLNGTLSSVERDRVRLHLATCAACRREYDDLVQQRAQLTAAYAHEAPPDRDLFPAILAGARARATGQPSPRSLPARGLAESVERWCRALLAPRWVPALAILFMTLQAGMLWWATALPPNDGIVERSIPPAVARVVVSFRADATGAQIRRALEDSQGRIVDGPRPDGSYVVQFPVADAASLDQNITKLRAHADTIERAERVTP